MLFEENNDKVRHILKKKIMISISGFDKKQRLPELSDEYESRINMHN